MLLLELLKFLLADGSVLLSIEDLQYELLLNLPFIDLFDWCSWWALRLLLWLRLRIRWWRPMLYQQLLEVAHAMSHGEIDRRVAAIIHNFGAATQF